jgi:hypothetical protein
MSHPSQVPPRPGALDKLQSSSRHAVAEIDTDSVYESGAWPSLWPL